MLLPLFCVSLGYLIVWLVLWAIPVIMVYPDENSVVYKDDADTCYIYRRVAIECPKGTTALSNS